MGTLLTNKFDSLDRIKILSPHQTSSHDGRRPRYSSLTVDKYTPLSRFRSFIAIFDHGCAFLQCGLDPFHGTREVGQDIGIGRIINFERVDVEVRWEGQTRSEEGNNVGLGISYLTIHPMKL